MWPFFAAGICAARPLRIVKMICQVHGLKPGRLPDNVVAFSCARRGRPATSRQVDETGRSSPHRCKRPVAISGAEMNARLLILFGICATSAALAVSSVHILLG
jgi:hypothetical protein